MSLQSIFFLSFFSRLTASQEYYKPFVVFAKEATEKRWKTDPVEELSLNLQLLSLRRESEDTVILR